MKNSQKNRFLFESLRGAGANPPRLRFLEAMQGGLDADILPPPPIAPRRRRDRSQRSEIAYRSESVRDLPGAGFLIHGDGMSGRDGQSCQRLFRSRMKVPRGLADAWMKSPKDFSKIRES